MESIEQPAVKKSILLGQTGTILNRERATGKLEWLDSIAESLNDVMWTGVKNPLLCKTVISLYLDLSVDIR